MISIIMFFLMVISVFSILYPIYLDRRAEKEIEAYEKKKGRTSSDGWSTLNEIFLDPEEFLK